MKLAPIPAGEFLMGGREPAEELVKAFAAYNRKPDFFKDEYPRHRVRITKLFHLGKYEVTVGQFRQFVKQTGYKTEPERDGEGGWGYNPALGKCEGRNPNFHWRNVGFPQTDDHPVVNVTWNDATAFCQWLTRKEGKTYRRPQAEWNTLAVRARHAIHNGDDRTPWPMMSTMPQAGRHFPTFRNLKFPRASGPSSPLRWATFRRTRLGCTTCMATFGSGVPTGTSKTTTPDRRWMIRPVRTLATGGCGGAEHGTVSRFGRACPSAIGTRRAAAASILASAS